jgi:hypothetical protein
MNRKANVALELLKGTQRVDAEADNVEIGTVRHTQQTALFALINAKTALTESEKLTPTRSASDRNISAWNG